MQEKKHPPVSGPRCPILPVSGSRAVINYLQLTTLLLEPLESSGEARGEEKGFWGSKGGKKKESEPRFEVMDMSMELVPIACLTPFFPWVTILMF